MKPGWLVCFLWFAGAAHAQTAPEFPGSSTWDRRSQEARLLIELYEPRNELCRLASEQAIQLKEKRSSLALRVDAAARLYCDAITRAFSGRMTVARNYHNRLVREDPGIHQQIKVLEKEMHRMDRRIRRAGRHPGWTTPAIVGRLQESSARAQGALYSLSDQMQAIQDAGFVIP